MSRWLDRLRPRRSEDLTTGGGDLIVENLTAGYIQTILQDVQLHLTAGRTLALLGHSGSGKSTLLAAISGLIRPTAGTVAIGGVDQSPCPPHRRPIAMLFQSDGLYPHLSVAANLRLPLRARCDRAQADRRLASIATAAGIDGWLDRMPGTLSGGQRRRVALAKTYATPAAVRLLDEPMTGIDAAHRHRLIESLDRWDDEFNGDARPATMWVTHDGAEAMWRGDRLAVMDAGRVIQTGPPSEIYCRPASAVVAEAIGTPPINWFGQGRQRLGCRPEDLQIGETAPDDAAVRHQCRVTDCRQVEGSSWWQLDAIDGEPSRWIVRGKVAPGSPPVGAVLWCWVNDRDVLKF